MPPNMPPMMMKALTDVAARNAQPKARPYKLCSELDERLGSCCFLGGKDENCLSRASKPSYKCAA